MKKCWHDLTENEKIQYEEYCIFKFGKSCVRSETGEPLYFDEYANLMNSNEIINKLFNIFKNK